MTTTPRAPWKARLEPFAHLYAQMDKQIADLVSAMSDEDLIKTLAATKRPTTGNVWWATYRVAPLVADVVREERHARRIAAKSAKEPR